MLRAPLKAVVRRTGLVRRVVERSMELPRRSEDTMVTDKEMVELVELSEAQFSEGGIN
jgi:hypothetical protein